MNAKFANFRNAGTYRIRQTPFFSTVQECEAYIIDNNINDENSYIHPVSNWEEVIENRNGYNTDSSILLGE
jgi:hypothetical protein